MTSWIVVASVLAALAMMGAPTGVPSVACQAEVAAFFGKIPGAAVHASDSSASALPVITEQFFAIDVGYLKMHEGVNALFSMLDLAVAIAKRICEIGRAHV